MRMYLAADFQRQLELREYRAELRLMGHEVTSRWLDNKAADDLAFRPNPAWRGFAQVDVDDIRAADAVISFTTGDKARGGRHVEYGLAVAWGKRRVLVGPVEHVFHMLPGTVLLPDPSGFMLWARTADGANAWCDP